MSAAGFDRVNITQRRFRAVLAANALSSTTTTIGNPASGPSGGDDSQNERIRGSEPESSARKAGPRTARIPGRATRGSEKPSGKDRPGGNSEASSRRRG